MRSDAPADRGRSPTVLRLLAYAGLAFLHFPILVIVLYAFNTEETAYSFPLKGFTLRWFAAVLDRPDVGQAVVLSLEVAVAATLVALVLGSLAAAALYRTQFRGKETITLALALPIALPGIVTGIALIAAFRFAGWAPSFWTIVIGHATFCLVIVYNNVVARLRRLAHSHVEAAMDLGADGFRTVSTILLPQIATALLAGGMLAFALSFDELIVTTFTAGSEVTLPIWLLSQLARPREAPITNVVAFLVMAGTAAPVITAYLLTQPLGEANGGSR